MEILGTKMWDMAPDILHHYKQTVDSNLLLHAHFDKDESGAGVPFLASSADDFQEKVFVGKSTQVRWWDEMGWESGDSIICVTPVTGPILRSGDGCSYGSKNYRDFMMAAADVPGCVGHLIYIDTPGGSAYAKNDFKYAIDYVKSKGQPVIGLVDGLCASAGMALASMCDEIYFINPMDRIGSIGTMCAFYAVADGVEDAVTHERFIEVYGSKSEFKNKEYRDAAVGNYDELQAEVDDLNEQFWNTIKTYRPQVLEEQMHGKIYNFGDVIGTLVDGQGTMQSCINRILELAGVQAETAPAGEGGEAAPAASDNHSQSVEVPGMTEDFTGDEPGEGVQMQVQEASEALEPVQTAEAIAAVQTVAEEIIQTTTETIQEINNPEDETTNEPVVPNSSAEVTASQNEEKKMKEYPLIMSALGLNALAVDKEGGYYMNAALCDVLESFVAQANQDKLTMDAKIQEVAQLNARIEELKGEHEQAINGLTEAHNQEIEKLNGEHAEAINALTEQKDGEIAELNNKVNEANSTIEGLNAQVEAKEAEIKEISEVVTEPQVPAAPTADGVQTVEVPTFECKSVVSDDMTAEQKKEALRKRREELQKWIG
jgi:protease-4